MMSRTPKLSFDDMPLAWARNPEFAQTMNGWGICAPYVEPFLNKVMMEARTRLGDTDPALAREIDMFIRQEATHYQMHTRFNREMHRRGYTALQPIEEGLKNDLSGFLKNKSFEFNLAYCVGFESFALYLAKFIFEEADDLFEGSDFRGADLWYWHLAEEFEHRSVCHDAFAKLSGNYPMRLYGALYAAKHLGRFKIAVVGAIMAKYRENMLPGELAASVEREKAFNRRVDRYVRPRLVKVLLPFYNPARYSPSPEVEAALERFSPGTLATAGAASPA